MRHVFLCLLILALSSIVLFGQRTTGTISGTVTDPSGAVVPNAKVTATSMATRAVSSVNANASGFYVILNLQPGPYRVDVAVTEFQGYEQTGIVLQVGQDLSVNVSLKIGSATETVTVTGQAPLVNTRDQSVSTAITPQFTEKLPLNGRNILQLMALAPDSSEHSGTAYANQYATRPDASAGFVTASGESRENSTAFYLNGGLDMDTFTQVANVFPNPDAIQEFTYETNSYNAKYGGLGGGVVNAVTRGGTNQFHGSAFEYVRNGILNSRNFFSANQDTLKRNQFGFSLGAPIQKDKTFVFFSFQRTTLRYGTTSNVAYGPTAAELAGDWSAIPTQLYNNVLTRSADGLPLTFTTTTSPATAFAGNQVPTSLYVPLSLKVLALVPMGDPITGKITYTSSTMYNDPQYVARVDRNFGEKLRIFGSILRDVYQNPLVEDPKNALTAGAAANWPSVHVAFNATYLFGPNLLTTVGGTWSRALIRYKGTHSFPSLIELGANFPDWLPSGEKEAAGDFGWFGWFTDDHYNISRNQYDFTNGWTYMRGNHQLEFGGEFTISQSITGQDYLGAGYPSSSCAYSGYSPLDFMLGQNCYYYQGAGGYFAPRGRTPAIYINDRWRVKPRLVLNLGLRWEPWAPFADHSTTLAGSQISEANYAAGIHSTRYPNYPAGVLARGDPGVPDGLLPSDYHIFDPRVGLAWDVRGNGKTSIRAGAGLYHDLPFGRMYHGTTTWSSDYELTDPTVPWFSPYNTAPFKGVFPAFSSTLPSNWVFPLPLSSAIGFDPAYKPPATAQWNLTIEHQLGQGFLVRGSYQGSESWHMFDSRDINSAVYIPGTNADGTPKSTAANVPQRRPWYAGGFGGPVILDEATKTASYNSLSISVEKRMTGKLSVLGGYRWAKCLDLETVAGMYNEEYSDSRNKMLDRGLCNSDIASQAKMAVVYDLPSAQSWGFAGRNILGGWTMSGIWNWRDGFPFSVYSNIDSNLDGTLNERADLVGNPNLAGGRSRAAKVQEWFNTAAFQNAAVGTVGNSPRNFLRGPGYFNLDYSLNKSFPIRYGRLKETQKIEFRAEFFNIFNHPNFNNPNARIGSLQLGQIQSARDPRIIQFALKFIF